MGARAGRLIQGEEADRPVKQRRIDPSLVHLNISRVNLDQERGGVLGTKLGTGEHSWLEDEDLRHQIGLAGRAFSGIDHCEDSGQPNCVRVVVTIENSTNDRKVAEDLEAIDSELKLLVD
jgi:hypothetical protein